MARQVSYGDYLFQEPTKVQIDLQAIYDEHDLAIVQHRLTVTVTGLIVVDDDDPDTNELRMEEIRQILNKTAQPLILQEVGWGDPITINGTGPSDPQDINGGPKPRMLRWMPLGGNRAAEIVWTCECVLSPCLEKFAGIVSASETHSCRVDRAGWKTISSTYHVKMDLRYTREENLVDNRRQELVDQFLRDVTYPDNFHVEKSHSFPDPARIEVSVTATEIASRSAYPPGVVSISAPFRARWQFPLESSAPIAAHASMNMNIELHRDTKPIVAWQIFQAHFAWRMQRFSGQGDGRIPIVLEISAGEDPYTLKHEFSTAWRYVGTMQEAMSGFSMFRDTGQKWEDWAGTESMDKHRTVSAIGWEPPQHKKKVNLCNQSDHEHESEQASIVESEGVTVFCRPKPPEDKSWMQFDSRLQEATRYRGYMHTAHADIEVSQVEFQPGRTDEETTSKYNEEELEGKIIVSEQAPDYLWVWKGVAVRYGYPIPPMGKVKIGGVTAYPVGDQIIENQLIGFAMCQPIYRCVWNIGLRTLKRPKVKFEEDNDPTGDRSVQDEGDEV
jgi:hypothetical protein